ncbi:MAG: DHH family phosphoesterase [Clostridium sp.]
MTLQFKSKSLVRFEKLNEEEILKELFRLRGVDNMKEFLNLSEKNLYNGMLLKNMKEGLNLYHKHIINDSRILILVDVDVDGLTSGALAYNYTKNLLPSGKIFYYQNNDKKHGIVLTEIENIIKDNHIDLLIIPDAGSNDTEQCKYLKSNYNLDILILDHHIIEKENPYAVVINSHDGEYSNSTLTGVGVVYKFCSEYDKLHNYNYVNRYLDLVAVGEVGDMEDVRNLETRYLCLQGCNNIKNQFLKELIVKQNLYEKIEDIKNITMKQISMKIAPPLNGVIRSGSPEERANLFRALIGEEEVIKYTPRKSKNNPNPEVELQSLQKAMARESINIKGKQDRKVKKYTEDIIQNFKEEDLNSKILIINGTDIIEEKTMTGLIANKLANEFKKPTIILRYKGRGRFGGSIRNYNLSPIESFKNELETTGLIKIEGHDNAGGVTNFKSSNIKQLKDIINNKWEDVNVGDLTYYVDGIMNIGKLTEKLIMTIGNYEKTGVFGGQNMPIPIFAITNVVINVEDIELVGDRKSVIKIKKKIGNTTFTFIKIGSSEEEYNKMIFKKRRGLGKSIKKVKFNFIVRFEINEFYGFQTPQLKIIDYDVTKNEGLNF